MLCPEHLQACSGCPGSLFVHMWHEISKYGWYFCPGPVTFADMEWVRWRSVCLKNEIACLALTHLQYLQTWSGCTGSTWCPTGSTPSTRRSPSLRSWSSPRWTGVRACARVHVMCVRICKYMCVRLCMNVSLDSSVRLHQPDCRTHVHKVKARHIHTHGHARTDTSPSPEHTFTTS